MKVIATQKLFCVVSAPISDQSALLRIEAMMVVDRRWDDDSSDHNGNDRPFMIESVHFKILFKWAKNTPLCMMKSSNNLLPVEKKAAVFLLTI